MVVLRKASSTLLISLLLVLAMFRIFVETAVVLDSRQLQHSPGIVGKITGKVLLCTSEGFKWVSLEQAAPLSTDHKDNPKLHCPYLAHFPNQPVFSSADLISLAFVGLLTLCIAGTRSPILNVIPIFLWLAPKQSPPKPA